MIEDRKPPENSDIETCLKIIQKNPYLLHGKSNMLIDWKTRDPFDEGNLKKTLLSANYSEREKLEDALFFSDERLNRCSLKVSGFGPLATEKFDAAREFFRDDPMKNGSLTYKTKSGRYLPNLFVNGSKDDTKYNTTSNTDLFAIQKDGPLFIFTWPPSLGSLADSRPSRNVLYCIVPDKAAYSQLVQILMQQSKINPSFFYDNILSRLFPKAFVPYIEPNDIDITKRLFDEDTILNWLNSIKGPFSVLTLNQVFKSSSPSLEGYSTWQSVMNYIETDLKTDHQPLHELLEKVLHENKISVDKSITRREFDSQMKMLVGKLAVMLRVNPTPYLTRLKTIATLKRFEPNQNIQVYDIDEERMQSVEEASGKLV